MYRCWDLRTMHVVTSVKSVKTPSVISRQRVNCLDTNLLLNFM